MKEYFDIVDELGEPTGAIVSREEAHSKGIWHHTAHVWILRYKAGVLQVLLQKRTLTKDSYPGCYDISSAGHIPAGTDYVTSALRELEEELGVQAQPQNLIFCGDRKIVTDNVFHGKEFHDRQYSRVFCMWLDWDEDKFTPQPEELDCVEWLDFATCVEKVQNNAFPHCIEVAELRLVEQGCRK